MIRTLWQLLMGALDELFQWPMRIVFICVHQWARVAHGRTRMIVFPLRRSVRLKGGDGVVEGRDVADVRPQSSVPHPLDDLAHLGTIGLDNEVSFAPKSSTV